MQKLAPPNLRMHKQITDAASNLRGTYKEMEKLQAEVAVSRTARRHADVVATDPQTLYLSSALHVRPETQKAILSLYAACTRTDVALNNLVIRARTGV